MIGIDYIKYVADEAYRDLVQAYRDWKGCNHVLRSQTHFIFCQTIQEAEIVE